MEETLKIHWFWKYTIGSKRLMNESLSIINKKIFFSFKIFYILLFGLSFNFIYGLNYYINKSFDELLWPVFWIDFFPELPWSSFLIIICFVLNIATILFNYQRVLRMLLFFFYFLFIALLNSSGKINHSLHTVLIPLFCFIFIDFSNKNYYKNYLVFASAVFMLLSSYFLAGFWKILMGLVHLNRYEKSIYNLDAFTRLLKFQYRYDMPSVITQWVMEHEFIGFILIWIGICIEFFSLGIFFFGKLHSLYGVALLMLHVSIAVIMDVNMPYTFITLVPILLISPFSKKNILY